MIGCTLPALLLAAGAIAPDVRGATRCPSPDEVARRLRPLLATGGELPTGAWVEIAESAAAGVPPPGGAIEVRMLAGSPPRVLGVRLLASPGSCDEAAQAVAVVVATWTASFASPAPLWSGEPRPVAPVQATDPETPSLSPSPRPRAGAVGEVRADGSRAGAEAFALDVGAGAGMAAAPAGTAGPFVTAEVDARGRGAASARLLVMAAGARSIALGSGQVAWRRLMAGAGVAHTWGTPTAHLEIGGDVLAGATLVDGIGFAQNGGSASFDAGVGPWVRAGARLAAAPVTVWLGAQALGWARRQQVRVDGVTSSGTLPRLDLLLGAGVSWTPLASKTTAALKQ